MKNGKACYDEIHFPTEQLHFLSVFKQNLDDCSKTHTQILTAVAVYESTRPTTRTQISGFRLIVEGLRTLSSSNVGGEIVFVSAECIMEGVKILAPNETAPPESFTPASTDWLTIDPKCRQNHRKTRSALLLVKIPQSESIRAD